MLLFKKLIMNKNIYKQFNIHKQLLSKLSSEPMTKRFDVLLKPSKSKIKKKYISNKVYNYLRLINFRILKINVLHFVLENILILINLLI